jgi:hypothetical protein
MIINCLPYAVFRHTRVGLWVINIVNYLANVMHIQLPLVRCFALCGLLNTNASLVMCPDRKLQWFTDHCSLPEHITAVRAAVIKRFKQFTTKFKLDHAIRLSPTSTNNNPSSSESVKVSWPFLLLHNQLFNFKGLCTVETCFTSRRKYDNRSIKYWWHHPLLRQPDNYTFEKL